MREYTTTSFTKKTEITKKNKAIIETLYSCGLRVSELVNLKISCLFFKDEFINIAKQYIETTRLSISN